MATAGTRSPPVGLEHCRPMSTKLSAGRVRSTYEFIVYLKELLARRGDGFEDEVSAKFIYRKPR